MEKGLPGLSALRTSRGLSRADVAELCGCSMEMIRLIESGKSDCSQQLQRDLAAVLHCTVIDLLSPPTEQRLAEIRQAYHLRQAELAAEDAKRAKGVA